MSVYIPPAERKIEYDHFNGRNGNMTSAFIPIMNPQERKARCDHCGRESYSRNDLPFWKSQSHKEYDIFYCGCFGWE